MENVSLVILTGVLWRVAAGVVGARSVRVVSFLCPGIRPQGEVCLGQQQSLLQAVRWLLEKTSVRINQRRPYFESHADHGQAAR